jgi:hypothetical protein
MKQEATDVQPKDLTAFFVEITQIILLLVIQFIVVLKLIVLLLELIFIQ